MEVNKKQLEKSQVELNVSVPFEDLKKYFEPAAKEISKDVKIEGFRQGNAPYDMVKEKVGEGAILEKAARSAVNETLPEAMKQVEGIPIDKPSVDITKMAPDNPLEYKAVVTLLPEVKLGDYKDLGIKKSKSEVKDEEIQGYIDYLKDAKAQEASADREAKEGDKVTLDVERFVDGEAIDKEGGAQDISIVLGKEQITKGFDDQIKGAKKGAELEFSLTYPEDSHHQKLAGKEVKFKVTVKEIYERSLPEVNDEFAKNLGFENLEQMKNSLKETAASEKDQYAEKQAESQILEKIVENSEFGEVPETLIAQETEKMLEEMEREIQSQGGSLENYLSQINKTKEQIKEEFKPQAEKRVKTALAIREIIQKEDIKVSDEEIENKRNQLLEQYKGYEKAEEHIKKPEYSEQLHSMLTNEKLMSKLKEWNLSQDNQESETENKETQTEKGEETKESKENKQENEK